jgi:hypothetical protein
MSRAMTMTELGELLKHIQAEHSPLGTKSGKGIKYAHPNIDFRGGPVCFSIAFRGFSFNETVFHTQNECRDLPASLFERVMAWLDEPIIPLQANSQAAPETYLDWSILPMTCPKCKVPMVHGLAIKTEEPCLHVCFPNTPTIEAKDLELIDCLKCPLCGHSEEVPKKE